MTLTALCCTASRHWVSAWVQGDQAATGEAAHIADIG